MALIKDKTGRVINDPTIKAQVNTQAPVSNVPMQQQVPPTGLIGSEQAMLQGYGNAMGNLLAGYDTGRGDVMGQLRQGIQGYQNALGSGNRSYNQGISAVKGAQGDINGYFETGIGQGNRYFDQGAEGLNPFVQPGQQAQQRQAALSGALGPEAQAQAMQGFMDSPGQQWLREQGERSVTRNAAALGGLGGGNVMKELTRFGTGLAAQDFDNQFNRLGQVTNQGLAAAGQLGSLRSQQGTMNANMRGQQAGLQGQMANALAGLYSNKANFGGQMAAGMGSLRSNAGNLLGNMGMQTGMAGANLAQSTGNNLAVGRTNAGNAIANSVANTTNNLSNLANQQGVGLSGMTDSAGNNLVNILTQAGLTQAQIQQLMGQGLAGVNMQGAGYVTGLPSIPGVQHNPGMMGGIGEFAAGVAQVAPFIPGLSDRRLKTNIKRIGETAGGTNVYTWDWTPEGAAIAGDQPTIGVMAQEVPDAAFMGADGYLRVNYARVK